MKLGLVVFFLAWAAVLGQQRDATNVIKSHDLSTQESLRGGVKAPHEIARRLVEADPQWIKLGQDLDGDSTDDMAGKSVTMSGDGTTVAMGAIQNGIGAGYVRVFRRNGEYWNQLGPDIHGVSMGDSFGVAVALSNDGSTLIIGASAGYVHVYQFTGSAWIQVGSTLQDGEEVAISADGNTIAIGAPTIVKGRVRVFQLQGSVWTQRGDDIVGEQFYDEAGHSVALSSDGETVAIGAPVNGGSSGHVRVYKFQQDWTKLGQDIDGAGAGNYFGDDVSISSDGMTVAVGAPDNSDNGFMSGHVQVFKYNGAQWNQVGGDINGENMLDNSGWAVALSADGETVAIGAHWNRGVNGFRSGQVRVFSYNGADWDQVGEDIDGEEAFDFSGHAVAISADGKSVAIGAYGAEIDNGGCDAGHVRVFVLPSNAGSGGDPHFKTWTNEHFQYHGQCDLVLVKDEQFAEGLGLDIHIRTKLVRYWSYIKSVVIRIGNDILEVEGTTMQEAVEPRYWINYEYQGEVEDLAGFPVNINSVASKWNKNQFEIDLDSKYPGQKIVIETLKEFVRVDFVNPTAAAFGRTVGMLGDFHTGHTLARDGTTTLNDFAELGHEWQVLPSDAILFHAVSAPQFPAKCIDPEDPRGDRRRRLQESTISEEEAEVACADLKDPLDRKDCVYDVLATQDMDMAGAF